MRPLGDVVERVATAMVLCCFVAAALVLYHMSSPRHVSSDDADVGFRSYAGTNSQQHTTSSDEADISPPHYTYRHHGRTTHNATSHQTIGWQYLPTQPLLGWHASGAVMARDSLYLPQGSDCDADAGQSVMRVLDNLDLDSAEWEWKSSVSNLRELPYLPLQRHRAATAHLGNWLFSIGGYDSSASPTEERADRYPRREAFMLDLLAAPKSGARHWVQIPALPESRAEFSCVTLTLPPRTYHHPNRLRNHSTRAKDTEQLFCVGGYTDGMRLAETTLVYDPYRMRWSKRAEMNVPRANVTLVAYNKTQLYAFGGYLLGEDGQIADAGIVEVYDATTDQWTLLPNDLPYSVASNTQAALSQPSPETDSIWLVGAESVTSANYQVVEYFPHEQMFLCHPAVNVVNATTPTATASAPLFDGLRSAFFQNGALHLAGNIITETIPTTTYHQHKELLTCARQHFVYYPDYGKAKLC